MHLTNAFVISDFAHFLAVGAMAKGFYPLRNVVYDLSIFFLAQPLSVMIEDAATGLFTHYLSRRWLILAAPLVLGNNNKGSRYPSQRQSDQDSGGESSSDASPVNANTAATGATGNNATASCGRTNNRDSGPGVSTTVGSVDSVDAVDVVTLALCRLAGYVWVLVWFSVTGWWFVKAYAGVRMQDWKLPYSILERLFPALRV